MLHTRLRSQKAAELVENVRNGLADLMRRRNTHELKQLLGRMDEDWPLGRSGGSALLC